LHVGDGEGFGERVGLGGLLDGEAPVAVGRGLAVAVGAAAVAVADGVAAPLLGVAVGVAVPDDGCAPPAGAPPRWGPRDSPVAPGEGVPLPRACVPIVTPGADGFEPPDPPPDSAAIESIAMAPTTATRPTP
jgi:hypothetical protein